MNVLLGQEFSIWCTFALQGTFGRESCLSQLGSRVGGQGPPTMHRRAPPPPHTIKNDLLPNVNNAETEKPRVREIIAFSLCSASFFSGLCSFPQMGFLLCLREVGK